MSRPTSWGGHSYSTQNYGRRQSSWGGHPFSGNVNANQPPQAPVDAAQSGGPGATAGIPADATSGPPVDPMLAAQQAQGQLAIGLGNVWDTYKTGQIGQQYGNLDNPAADAATNPYSQAALAYKRYNESQAGTRTSYAASGQLYSGALQNATEANAGNYSQNLAGLRQSRQGALDSITEGGLNRYSSYLGQQGTDSLASIMKALGL